MSSSQNLVLSTNLGRIDQMIMFNTKYNTDSERPSYQDMAEIPTFYFSLASFPSLELQLDYPSKCSVIVFHGLQVGRLKGKINVPLSQFCHPLISGYSEDAGDAVAKLEEMLQQIPKFVLVITGESPEEYFASIKSAFIPWIISGPGGPVISLGLSSGLITNTRTNLVSLLSVCPASPLIRRVSLSLLTSQACPSPRVPRQLRVAFNNESLPYFDLKEGKADVSTLEGAVLQLFLDKYQIRSVSLTSPSPPSPCYPSVPSTCTGTTSGAV